MMKRVLFYAVRAVFYDRNNLLLASLHISEYYLERIRLNMYSGVIFASSFSPGLFFTLGECGTSAAGSTMQISPVGFGLYSPH
ncbi:MAG: hypothetical protein ABSD46_03555 [Bacteroidota bacterium]